MGNVMYHRCKVVATRTYSYRCFHSTKLIPKLLRDVAAFIRLTIEYHIKDDIEDVSDSEDEDDNIVNDSDASNTEKKTESMNNMIVKIVENGAVTVNGGLSGLTAFEPRIIRVFCQCAAPVNLVGLLSDLTKATNEMMFSSLTLRAFSKAGFQELQMVGLKGKRDYAMFICAQITSLTNSWVFSYHM